MHHQRDTAARDTAALDTLSGTQDLPDSEQTLHQLHHLLNAGQWALFQLPASLERHYRAHASAVAARFLRKSVYGLIALYLIVVSPVLLFSSDTDTGSWFGWAVFPIGAVLAYLWLAQRFTWFEQRVEVNLGGCLAICISGTLYASFLLHERFLGYVAGFETVYIVIIGFSVLRIRTATALAACLAALSVAYTLAWFNNLSVDVISLILFFISPLLVGIVNGYIQEGSSRRVFVQQAYQQAQVALLKKIMLSGETGDDTGHCLSDALHHIAVGLGWQAVRVYVQQAETGQRALPLTVEAQYPPAENGLGVPWPEHAVTALVEQVWRDKRYDHHAGVACMVEQADGVSASGKGMTYLAFPLQVSRYARGVLLCQTDIALPQDDEFTDFIAQLCDHIARFLERIRQERILRTLALHDSLTGLKNRAAFLESLEAAFCRYQRNPAHHFCVLFMDLDRFKWVNDHLGHHAGDDLLVAFSQRLLQVFRQNDVVARLGGDEFALIIEQVGMEELLELVARIQARYEETIQIDDEALHLVASIGVAFVQPHHTAAAEVLAQADQAMYQAKSSRKGSCHVAERAASSAVS